MSAKWVIFICFIFIFSSFSFSLNIKWYDQNGYEITKPDKNQDSKYWMDAMDNTMRDIFTRCLPKDWRNRTKDFYNSNVDITIMISDVVPDWNESQEEKKAGKNLCICGGMDNRDGKIMLFFRPKKSDQTREGGCCYCPEASVLHELIHAAAGVTDAYDPQIEACVYLALKTAGNCVNNLPTPQCKCRDHKGNNPPPDCK
jgi:hypothetical protein